MKNRSSIEINDELINSVNSRSLTEASVQTIIENIINSDFCFENEKIDYFLCLMNSVNLKYKRIYEKFLNENPRKLSEFILILCYYEYNYRINTSDDSLVNVCEKIIFGHFNKFLEEILDRNIGNLIPTCIVEILLRNKGYSRNLLGLLLQQISFERFKLFSSFLASCLLLTGAYVNVCIKNIYAFIDYPDILALLLKHEEFKTIDPNNCYYLSYLNPYSVPDERLIALKCPDRYALTLFSSIERYYDAKTVADVIRSMHDDELENFFKTVNVTEKNQGFWNDEVILRAMIDVYADNNWTVSSKFFNQDLVANIIIDNHLYHFNFFLEILNDGIKMVKELVIYYCENIQFIKSNPKKLFLSISAEDFNDIIEDKQYSDMYHILLKYYVVRKVEDVDTIFHKIRLPEKDEAFYSDMDMIFQSYNDKENYKIVNNASRSAQTYFYAGQLLNTHFDGQLEWRFHKLEQIDVICLLACSVCYFEPTTKLQRSPFFVYSIPFDNMILFPSKLYNTAIELIIKFYCARCHAYPENSIPIYLILSLYLDTYFKTNNQIPLEFLRFFVRETEVSYLKSLFSSFSIQLLRECISQRGSYIIHVIASNSEYFEKSLLYEHFDSSLFDESCFDYVLRNPTKYSHFLSRIISNHVKPSALCFSEFNTACNENNVIGCFNIATQLSKYQKSRALQLLIMNDNIPPLAALAILTLPSSPLGDYILNIGGIERFTNFFVEVINEYQEYSHDLARILQAAFFRLSTGKPSERYVFEKRFLEFHYVSLPMQLIKLLLSSSSSSRQFATCIEQTLVRVNENIVLKKDWHNFPGFSETSTEFTENLFFALINNKTFNRQSICLLTMIAGTKCWMIPNFKTPREKILRSVLELASVVENADIDPDLGQDSFQLISVLFLILRSSVMRETFFEHFVGKIDKLSIGMQICVCILVTDFLLDSRTQYLVFISINQYIEQLSKLLIVPQNPSNPQKRLLVIVLRMFDAFQTIYMKLSALGLELAAKLAAVPNFYTKYDRVDGGVSRFHELVERGILFYVLNIKSFIPNENLHVCPRCRGTNLSAESYEKFLPKISMSDPDVTGIASHLPLEIQCRYFMKKIPERPKNPSAEQYFRVLDFDEVAHRYLASPFVHLVLPTHSLKIAKALNAIVNIKTTSKQEQLRINRIFIARNIVHVMNVTNANIIILTILKKIVYVLCKDDECAKVVIESVSSGSENIMYTFCSVIKKHGFSSNFMKNYSKSVFYPKAVEMVHRGSMKLAYPLIIIYHQPNFEASSEAINIIRMMINSKSEYTRYRGLKLAKHFPEKVHNEFARIYLDNNKDNKSIKVLLDIFPEFISREQEFFKNKLNEVIDSGDSVLISILVDAFALMFKPRPYHELLSLNPWFWDLVILKIEEFWILHKERDLFKFFSSFMYLLPFNTRLKEYKENIKRLVENKYIIVIQATASDTFNSAMSSIEKQLINEKNLRAPIFIKYPEMKKPEAGGILREWFRCVNDDMLENSNIFLRTNGGNFLTFNPNYTNYSMLELIGKFIGIVILNNEMVNFKLAIHHLKAMWNRELTYHDLESSEPDIYNGVKLLMDPTTDIESLNLTFSHNYYGKRFDLIENGSNIDVTAENKDLFIQKLCELYYYGAVSEQLKHFAHGLNVVIPFSNFKHIFAEEFLQILYGSDGINVEDLIRNFELLPPLTENHPIVSMFFRILRKWDQTNLDKFLVFLTSSKKIPIGGFSSLKSEGRQPKLKLLPKSFGDEYLPSTLTCLSHISLPNYTNIDIMEKKILQSINESSGFR